MPSRSAVVMAGAGGTTIPVSARSPMGGQVSGGRDANELASIRAVAAAVPDPEIPALNLEDLGILRAVDVDKDGHVVVTITPTYSGCPAMEAITADVKAALAGLGYVDVTVRQVLAPAWTTDNMTQEGKAKLLEYGIAPPGRHSQGPVSVALSVRCPQCGSVNTRELSRFGSTACKSLWACNDCREPFDHFKAI